MTIPASQIVNVIPSVLAAGGTALAMVGLGVTQSPRVPIGTVQSFPTPLSVSNYFGAASKEAAEAAQYFSGSIGATATPGSMLWVQYPQSAVDAYIRGGSVAGLTLAQLQAITGTLTITVDGVARSAAALNLSAAASFSAAAGLIQTALNGAPTQQAAVTGSIAAGSPAPSFTGNIAGNVLTVTSVTAGVIQPGTIITGTGVAAGTMVQNQTSGTTGGIGTYAVSGAPQNVPSTAITGTYGVLTVSAITSGTLAVGQTLSGSNVTAGTQIAAQLTGTPGGTGTYVVTPSQTVVSTAITANPTNVACTFDSIASAFVVTSGVLIPNSASSTVGFATGSTSTALALTSATGAVLSQGAAGQTPSAFMNTVIGITQDWATFFLDFDPDNGNSNAQKLAFAQWNSAQNNRYLFACWDPDNSPATSAPAGASLGALITAQNVGGTALLWEGSGDITTEFYAAFLCGQIAAINFTAPNGRTDSAFRSGQGLVANVTNPLTASNLSSNGYNYYGVWGTAAQNFTFLYPGSVSGPFQWIDSYINQIWLNNALQLALIQLLTQVSSIPYNADGDSLIEAACMGPIQAAVNFGAIRAGVTLSPAQVAEVNAAAGGLNIAPTIQQRGWYLLVLPAAPGVRQARQSPPITLFYMDGQSVQQISLASILLQ